MYKKTRLYYLNKFVVLYAYTFSVEDMSSLAEVTTLIEVSLDGNPVALGGDCTPFLVSYLPNLVTLTNMHVTEQVSK